MSRSDLTPDERAELEALDAIIAGDPIGDDQLELAALVEAVRRTAPALDDAGRARIDARVDRARTRRRRRAQRQRGRPRLALAGGTLVALAVALAAVVGSGMLGGSTPRAGDRVGTGRPGPRPANAPPARGTRAAGAAVGGGASAAPEASKALTSLPPHGHGALLAPDRNPAGRLVARTTSLTLATPPGQMQAVANEVVSDTQRFGGIVESSNVAVHGRSSYSSFSLSVPSTHLAALIGALSSLAGVRSLDQSTSDITDRYNQARALLADERAQRAGLLKALAAATSLTQEQQIQHRIDRLDGRIAAAAAHVDGLLSRGRNAKLAVALVAGGAAGAAAGGGPVSRALHDALSVLDVALAVVLVALAILLPLALVGLALWWAAAGLRQRARERALGAPATR